MDKGQLKFLVGSTFSGLAQVGKDVKNAILGSSKTGGSEGSGSTTDSVTLKAADGVRQVGVPMALASGAGYLAVSLPVLGGGVLFGLASLAGLGYLVYRGLQEQKAHPNSYSSGIDAIIDHGLPQLLKVGLPFVVAAGATGVGLGMPGNTVLASLWLGTGSFFGVAGNLADEMPAAAPSEAKTAATSRPAAVKKSTELVVWQPKELPHKNEIPDLVPLTLKRGNEAKK